MPELPEVETVRRGLEPAMVGACLVRIEQRRPDLRFPFPERFVQRLEGQTVTSLGRRAKYLLADLSSDEVLVMHLGMSGRFLVTQGDGAHMPGAFHHGHGEAKAHDHVVLHLSNGIKVIYNDARRFGFMDLVPRSQIEICRHFSRMGLEPLGNALSGEAIAGLFRGRRTSLKTALLDQRLIAGLGNIYVCEALFRSALHPETPAGSLVTEADRPKETAHCLAAAIRDVLTEAIAAGGSTLRDHAHVNGDLGSFQHAFRVYDREGEPCIREGCGGRIMRIAQAGRSTFFCPQCQN